MTLFSFIQLDTERQYVGNFRVGKNPVDDEKLEGWIAHLPQALWEIGSSNLPTTEVSERGNEISCFSIANSDARLSCGFCYVLCNVDQD